MNLPDDLTSTLKEGRQAYVAVPSKHGPHVTPELYAWSDGRLWFAAAAGTVKSNVLKRDGHGGAMVTSGGRSVVMCGKVEPFDPRAAKGVVAALVRLPRVAKASASFVTRNASDMVGFVSDAVRGRLGKKPPPMRVLFALEPDRAVAVENERILGAWGEWSAPSEPSAEPVPAGGATSVVGLPGPVPVPARWFEESDEFFVAPDLLDLFGLSDEFPASLVTDEYRDPGPAAKEGTLRRGDARLTERPGFISMHPERVVEWNGVETSSRPAS